MKEIAEIIITVGGIAVLFGAFDLFDFDGDKGLKETLLKIVGGVVVMGVGLLMKHFGI